MPNNTEENDFENDFENEEENEQGNSGSDHEMPENTPIQPIADTISAPIDDTVADTMSDPIGEAVDDYDFDPDLLDALSGEMEEEEEEDDPLDDYTQDEADDSIDEPIKETYEKATGNSVKNLENLDRLAGIALEGLDALKAGYCSKISGEQAALFSADKKQLNAVIEAGKEYLNTLELKAPTPAGTLLLAIGMWLGGSVGTAFAFKYELIPSIDPIYKQETAEPLQKNKSYEHLREVQQERRSFEVFKDKGTYRKTPKGVFQKKAVANEIPSPEIQDMIDDGKSNEDIRRVLYGE